MNYHLFSIITILGFIWRIIEELEKLLMLGSHIRIYALDSVKKIAKAIASFHKKSKNSNEIDEYGKLEKIKYNTVDIAYVCEVEDVTLARADDDVGSIVFINPKDIDVSKFGFQSIRNIVSKYLTEIG